MAYTRKNVDAALRHLRAADPVMAEIIRRVGPFRLKARRDRFGMLVRSIISQQISGSAARSILARLHATVAPDRPTAENLARLTPEELRAAGVSPQKAAYLYDLSAKTLSGQIQLQSVGRLPNEEVIAQLTQVKGIGRWTAQMFLIFSLGRLDVFPHDDLGVRSAIRRFYGLRKLPSKDRSLRIASLWSPYESVASWYCWRATDLPDE